MRGGKPFKTNKAEEIWYKLLLSDDFKEDLSEIEKSLKSKHEETPELLLRVNFLLNKHNATPTTDLRNLCIANVLSRDV